MEIPVRETEIATGKPLDFPVVAVGGSAGGLEAYQQLFSNASSDQNIAYVLISHLDPTHDSLLGELLGKRTDLNVVNATDGCMPEPNTVHLITPDQEMAIEDGVLRLRDFDEPRGQRRPIDTFFISLAKDQGRNSGCIVLSGTGADGTEGLRAVKSYGGLTIAQLPGDAKYAAMPASAVTTGLVDLILPAENMPQLLFNYFQNGDLAAIGKDDEENSFFDLFLHVIRQRTGYDFTNYRQSSILRRIRRRMQVLGVTSERDYVDKMVSKPSEADQLFNDILINVTEFFRDPEMFDKLSRKAIRRIVEGKRDGDTIRVWVPGCSSGEEAYSLAILLLEQCEKNGINPEISVFATDIDPNMIARGKAAIYPLAAIKPMPEELRDKYFEPDGDKYALSRKVTSIVKFSRHSLIKDPPFSKLDLVSCRNLLIYFSRELQEDVLPIFHYALNPGGYLFLGPSETLADRAALFKPIDNSAKIFQRAEVETPRVNLPIGDHGDGETAFDAARQHKSDMKARPDLLAVVKETVSKNYLPPHMLLDPVGGIRFMSKDVGRFVRFNDGPPPSNLSHLADAAMRLVIESLRSAVSKEPGRRHKAVDVAIEFEAADFKSVTVIAERFGRKDLLIVFSASDGNALTDDDGNSLNVLAPLNYGREMQELKTKLGVAEQELRTTIEELETSNEELKSSNEEMMSMNEELQSANEELTTVNDELQNKIAQLADANTDIANYLSSTEIAVIFLNPDFSIRDFTPAAKELFSFTDTDRNRKLHTFSGKIDGSWLDEATATAMESDASVEIDLIGNDGSTYLTRIMPYITADRERDGLVVTFVNVTDLTKSNNDLANARTKLHAQVEELQEIYRMSPQGMGMFDTQKRYVRVNRRLADINGASIESHYGLTTRDIVPGLADIIETPMDTVMETGKPILGQIVIGPTPANPEEDRVFEVDWFPVAVEGHVASIGVCVRDITEYRETEETLRRVMRELQHRVKNMLANVIALVRITKRGNAPIAARLDTLSQRIASLAKTHDILTQANWKTTSISNILETELTAVYGKERIRLKGPDVQCGSKATLALAMAFHELATNAVKYGALSRDKGKVLVTWKIQDEGDGRRLRIEWEESGGPAVSAPGEQGFGTSLIDANISRTLEGNLSREFEPSGLICVIDVALTQIKDTRDDADDEEEGLPNPFR